MIKTRLVGLLSHAKKYIIYNILFQWFALLWQVAAVFTIADVMEKLVYGNAAQINVIRTIGILCVVVAMRIVNDRQIAAASYRASVDVKRILREKIYEKVLRLGSSYREKIATSEIVQVSTEGVDQLETYFGKYLPQLFYSLLAPLTLFVILCRVSLRASVVLLICVPLIPMSIVIVQKIAKRLLHKYWGIYTSLGDSFLENLQGLTTLKVYQADARKAKEMDAEAQRFRQVTMKVLTMQLNSTSVMDIVAYGGAAIGMVVALQQFLAGELSLSGMICMILLASEFFLPLRLLGSYFHIAMNGMAASDKIFAILDLEEPQQGTGVIDGNMDISLEHVSFSYDVDKEILHDICLSLPEGSFTSLVGVSGSGKSTIAGLLAAKNKAYQGHIMVGEWEFANLAEDSVRKNIVLVRHNSYLFKGTLEDNLRMANPNAAQEELWEVLEKVNLKTFAERQDGLHTQVAERGSNLSGGQCQRLAIARALLADAKMYIFDEATSNIDMESEEIIMQVIHELAQTKTILLISHRLANVVASDKIYMLKDGNIVEQGTHASLMAQKEAYYTLFEAQQKLEHFGEEALA